MDKIFDKYLNNKCPVCDEFVDSEDPKATTSSGGKCMAKYFTCLNCFSEYTVGYNRHRMPIKSEITYKGGE